MTELAVSDLIAPDPNNGHSLRPRPHLCSACSQIDFKALFTSHGRPIAEETNGGGRSQTLENRFHQPPLCECIKTFEVRDKSGWPTLESAADSKPTCSFCAFYIECLLNSKDLELRSTTVSRDLFQNGPFFRAFHSLTGFWLEHDIEGSTCQYFHMATSCEHYAQDVAALQFLGEGIKPGLMFSSYYRVAYQTMGHAILRLRHEPEFAGLARSRTTGGGAVARRIFPDQINYNLILDWLGHCCSAHTHCHGDADVSSLPGFQVIDCTTRNIISAADAFGTDRERNSVEYITLSYVWGEAECSGPVLRDHGFALPSELPLVIRDAITVVTELGYRYLWVDRYCIPQNNSQAKQEQIKSMGRIYSCSALTIIAAAGDGPDYGLPGVSSRHRTTQLTVEVAEGISLALYEKPTSLIGTSKWMTRGWTYQEGVLSRRRLLFTDQLIYFQCCEMYGDEVLSLPLFDVPVSTDEDGGQSDQLDNFHIQYISLNDEDYFLDSIFQRRIDDWSNPDTVWTRIDEFVQRQLSYDTDTLDAIAGVLGKYTTHITGMQAKDHQLWFFHGLPICPFSSRRTSRDENLQVSTGSLQTLWIKCLDQPKFKGPHSISTDGVTSADGDGSDNLTCRLLESLIWIAIWDDSTITPERNRNFPSWTWAGWKACSIQHYDDASQIQHVFDSCSTVHVEYAKDSGLIQRLDWETDNEEIQKQSRLESRIPFCLVITGTVMDMKLVWRERDSGFDTEEEEPDGWTFTWPPFLEGESLLVPRCMFDDIDPEHVNDSTSTGNNGDKEVHVLGLCLVATFQEGLGYSLPALVLKPVTKVLDMQPHKVYERAHLIGLDCIYFFNFEYNQDWGPASAFFRETTVRLC
ncbi:heterokaryon incompatibility protein-domain-containing protein [Sordaria brevicollis]|uniref:Heterokaryon incompatibility protein-domain-containing protein n=1 Tax=Sordaria brevicollis TaxID=83679 RepID=A0AAE0U678_SORBR|nr:heterokaryon incompatibility protein-domain-containing protein [Sordaria brevicollis]